MTNTNIDFTRCVSLWRLNNSLDLIVCRNVVIYFSPEVKTRLYKQFHDALRPGGVLFVGSTEVLSHTSEIGFKPMDISFYRREA